MPSYRRDNPLEGLAQMIGVGNEGAKIMMDAVARERQLAQQKQMPGIEEQANEQLMKSTSATKQLAGQEQLKNMLGLVKSGQIPEGAGINMGEGGPSISRQPNLGMYDLKKQQIDTAQQNKYSKSLEKYSDLSGAAQDLETITNRDGKGGIFTNPNAQMISGGKVISAIPDSMLGMAELTGAAPAGTAEERKALARYRLSMGHALTGARMNPTMQKAIQDSFGGMASGDPNLMAKGLRGSGRILGGTIKTVQGGFSPEVRGYVHDQGNGDPMELFGKIPPENAPPSNYISPPAGSGQQQAQPRPQQSAPQSMRVKHKASGQTGTIPSNEFDPNVYEQVQ